MESGTDLLHDIVIIFIAAAVGGLAARLIRLPPLIGYLVVGAVKPMTLRHVLKLAISN